MVRIYRQRRAGGSSGKESKCEGCGRSLNWERYGTPLVHEGRNRDDHDA